jgi:hypothetical protein
MSASTDGTAVARRTPSAHRQRIDINAQCLKNCVQVLDLPQIVLLATADIALSVPRALNARMPKYHVPELRFSTT